eukprot:758761-Hanusia_phi.AAC.4
MTASSPPHSLFPEHYSSCHQRMRIQVDPTRVDHTPPVDWNRSEVLQQKQTVVPLLTLSLDSSKVLSIASTILSGSNYRPNLLDPTSRDLPASHAHPH